MKGRENAAPAAVGPAAAPLAHGRPRATPPARTVVLGARGLLGRAVVAELERSGMAVLALASTDIDLTSPGASDALSSRLLPGDAVLVLAAVTPDRSRAIDATFANLRMGAAVCAAVAAASVAHVVYVSSDAVYPFVDEPVTESTCASAPSPYGVMHRTRETMLRSLGGFPLAVLRPTMVYGAGDTHTSYGPTRFLRSAVQDGLIALFGDGEERRDFIHVGDVARLVRRVLLHESRGVLNLATGVSTPYARLAELVAACVGPSVRIEHLPRQVPVTHRSFDVAACRATFPDFDFTSLEEGLAQLHRRALDDPRGAGRETPA